MVGLYTLRLKETEIKQDLTDPYKTHTKTAVQLTLQMLQQYSDGTHNMGTIHTPCYTHPCVCMETLERLYEESTQTPWESSFTFSHPEILHVESMGNL